MNELAELIDRICIDHGGDAAALWRALAETGLTRVGVAERLGGSGGGITDAITVVGSLAENAAAVPVAEQVLLAGWLAEQADIQLPDGLVAVAAGPHDAIRVTGKGPSVEGVAYHVPWGSTATHVLAIAQSTVEETVVALVPAGQVSGRRPGANLAGEPRDRLEFAGAKPVAVSQFTGPVRDELLVRGALTRSVQIAGSLRAVLRLTLRYSAERHQFGRPLALLDPVRQQVATMAGEVAATAAAVDAALAAVTAGAPAAGFAVAAAKLQAGTAATTAARIAHQVHGAMGFTREHSLHRHTTRLWSWRDEFGSEEYWARLVFDSVHDASSLGLWPALVAPGPIRPDLGGRRSVS